ncbi:MAG: exodeoxyribonuclease VII small subunit [Sulfurimicrobium sp.]|nr:exodeoxyribonuclease VII small subunit [Sulfurimicrobium sp.]MDO9191137.1 exodeoxyribonuclease VII small subunit [Sulfurimicrobium sp.]MDP1704578.1 exodeoxyribonuclease VII small subunit [Sulfurimicrobium sp.]MDP2200205.1 exodeoxyribonuclease VII small subunit [Sulfurimicrobium sp.]MDP3687258.1 exodeoxyribonuclease VII small subunit [Sulfurimicrobium sp.]
MSRTAKNVPPKSFESALAELEQVVTDMETGQLPLEQSLAAYRRGAELLRFCQETLQDAQQQVKIMEAGSLRDFSIDGGNAGASE